MLIQSNIVRGKTSRITKNILVSNLHFILSFSVISHQSQRRILFTPYHCSEQNERLILFPHIMYLFYQTMNGNALSLKNVRLKKFIRTRYVLKDLKRHVFDSVQSVSLTESFCYHPITSAYIV